MKGKRKFITTLLALVIYFVLMFLKDLNPQELGFGLGAILFGFGIPNSVEHFKGFKK